MDNRYFVNNNCVNLSSESQTVFWGNNSTDLLIEIQANMWAPLMTYYENLVTYGNYSVLHYLWCGPMMLIIKEFAKRVNAK